MIANLIGLLKQFSRLRDLWKIYKTDAVSFGIKNVEHESRRSLATYYDGNISALPIRKRTSRCEPNRHQLNTLNNHSISYPGCQGTSSVYFITGISTTDQTDQSQGSHRRSGEGVQSSGNMSRTMSAL